MVNKPLCFVLMPFGKKVAGGTHTIDFDQVYNNGIKPAVEAAGLDPIRADEEEVGGIIHKPMFERLILCDYAVADLTTANANVFYELGVRHAAKERSTALLFAEGHGRLPFDVAQLRALPYEIDNTGALANASDFGAKLTDKLVAAKTGVDKDSPLYQLLDDYPHISHEKTDVFRRQVEYSARIKASLKDARKEGIDRIRAVEATIGIISDVEAGISIDLILSYRAVEAWEDMIRIAGALNPILSATILVREQLAFALNRNGDTENAERILLTLIDERGESSETLGILGRVYKDRWVDAKRAGDLVKAKGALRRMVNTYKKGFEADWRDTYPGVNAVTFQEILEPNDPELPRLRSVVRYSLDRKLATDAPDYWDYATGLELAVLDRDRVAAERFLEDALSRLREPWEAKTTANNLTLLLESKRDDDSDVPWIESIRDHLATAI